MNKTHESYIKVKLRKFNILILLEVRVTISQKEELFHSFWVTWECFKTHTDVLSQMYLPGATNKEKPTCDLEGLFSADRLLLLIPHLNGIFPPENSFLSEDCFYGI